MLSDFLLLSLSLIFSFCLLAFFSTIVDISTFSWHNGFILEVFLFFNYFFYPSSSTLFKSVSLCFETVLQAHLFAFTEANFNITSQVF